MRVSRRLKNIRSLSLVQKFNVISLILLLVSLVIIGSWVSNQIETRVVARIGHTSSLFAGSVIAPAVRTMLREGDSSEIGESELMAMLFNTSLDDEIVAMKIWDSEGRILSSTNPEEIGKVYEIEAGLKSAWSGVVSAEISDMDREEHVVQRLEAKRLLETYSPIREPGTGRILAVVEFYQSVTGIEDEIRDARIKSWIIVCTVVAIIYLSLVFLVGTGSRTILHQRDELDRRVHEYRQLLDRNSELNQRVRASAVRTTALNERYLRTIAAELHDGPAQDLGYTLLILDRADSAAFEDSQNVNDRKNDMKMALERSLKEIRDICAGLKSPELERLSVDEVVKRAARIQGNRSGTRAIVQAENLPLRAPLAIKITIFRIIQEALTNAHRHANDSAPLVRVAGTDGSITMEVIDKGPGFYKNTVSDDRAHLGVSIMKERVEILGGEFEIDGNESEGTTVRARIPFNLNGGQ